MWTIHFTLIVPTEIFATTEISCSPCWQLQNNILHECAKIDQYFDNIFVKAGILLQPSLAKLESTVFLTVLSPTHHLEAISRNFKDREINKTDRSKLTKAPVKPIQHAACFGRVLVNGHYADRLQGWLVIGLSVG